MLRSFIFRVFTCWLSALQHYTKSPEILLLHLHILLMKALSSMNVLLNDWHRTRGRNTHLIELSLHWWIFFPSFLPSSSFFLPFLYSFFFSSPPPKLSRVAFALPLFALLFLCVLNFDAFWQHADPGTRTAWLHTLGVLYSALHYHLIRLKG